MCCQLEEHQFIIYMRTSSMILVKISMEIHYTMRRIIEILEMRDEGPRAKLHYYDGTLKGRKE